MRTEIKWGSIGNKVFSIVICLIPILCMYKSPIPTVTLGEFVLMICSFILVVLKGSINFIGFKGVTSFVIYLFISLIISYLSSAVFANVDALIRTFRYSLWFFLIYEIGKDFFSYDYAVKCIKTIGLLAALLIIIQFVFAQINGYVFRPVISSLVFESKDINTNVTGRYSSFFIEPSYFGEFIMLPMIFYLFNEKKKVFDWFNIVVITIAVIISTAGSAYVSILVVYATYLVFNKRIKIKSKIVFILFAGIMVPFILRMESFDFVVNRLQNTEALGWRLNAYDVWINEVSQNPLALIFGVGYGNTAQFASAFEFNRWYPSAAYFLICLGITGIVLFVCVLYNGWKYSKRISSFALAVLLLVQSIYTDSIHMYYIIYYLPFLYAFNASNQYETSYYGLNRRKRKK